MEKSADSGCALLSWSMAMGLGLEQSAWLGIIVAIVIGLAMTLMCGTPRTGLVRPQHTGEDLSPRRVSFAPAKGSRAKSEPAPEVADDEGKKPELFAAPVGAADDLKRIKGIGPGLEKALNDMGVHHFGQIAAWTPAEVAWVDRNLVQFKGRASRDDWVDQARLLASGGETEFSRRVDKGEVYD